MYLNKKMTKMKKHNELREGKLITTIKHVYFVFI